MANFHFVEDYQNYINNLIQNHDIDTAMSLAVGGAWSEMGNKLADVLCQSGLKDGHSVLDFGCGSGRVAHHIAKKLSVKNYLGIDIMEELLNYARNKTPANYKYIKNQSLFIPADNNSFDYAFAFSVFTHLLQTEIFIYMEEISRILKKDGLFLFSFLEVDNHFSILEASANNHLKYGYPHPVLNQFLSRDQVLIISKNAGLKHLQWIEPSVFGQTGVLLVKD